MPFIIALGVGAGLVSALLLGTIAAGSALGVLLFWLAPLPLIIVALGWHWLVAALAALSAGIALSEVLSAKVALAYMAMIGAPATLIGALALRRRNDADPEGGYLSTGALVLTICLYAALTVLIGSMLIDPSLSSLQARLARGTETLLRLQFGLAANAPLRLPNGGQDLSEIPRLYALLAPSFGAATMTLTLLLSLWLGGLAVRYSGRLLRPWPPLDQTRLPFGTIAVFGVGIGLAQFSGYAGLAGDLLMSLLLIAFALQGFSVAHALSRGAAFRVPLLLTLWLSALLIGLPVLFIAALGVLDHFLDLRRRFPRAGGKT